MVAEKIADCAIIVGGSAFGCICVGYAIIGLSIRVVGNGLVTFGDSLADGSLGLFDQCTETISAHCTEEEPERIAN